MMRLGTFEIDVLQSLARGETPLVPSSLCVRFELLGLATESPQGLKLTAAGVAAAKTAVPVEHEKHDSLPQRFDAAGRKRMLDRKVDFS